MNTTIATAALVATLTGGSAYYRLVGPPPTKMQQLATIRGDQELCADLTWELEQSAREGLISQEEAEDISARCYRYFVRPEAL